MLPCSEWQKFEMAFDRLWQHAFDACSIADPRRIDHYAGKDRMVGEPQGIAREGTANESIQRFLPA
jgi:hypothetical protein